MDRCPQPRPVIGAGSAGCVLANRLSADPSRKVLVLEAGRAAPIASDIPSDWVTMFNTGSDWGYYTEPQAGCRGRRISRKSGASTKRQRVAYPAGRASQ